MAIALTITSPVLADEATTATDEMLTQVGTMMETAGYPGTGRHIVNGNLRQQVAETAFDICQERALGTPDSDIWSARSQGAQTDEDQWLLLSIWSVVDAEYCEAIGADEYIP